MSFIHWDVVAIVDPADVFELPDRANCLPAKLKILAAVPEDEVKAIFADASSTIRDAIEVREDGSVWLCWSSPLGEASQMHELAMRLADSVGGVVMTGMFQILSPKSARRVQQDSWRNSANE